VHVDSMFLQRDYGVRPRARVCVYVCVCVCVCTLSGNTSVALIGDSVPPPICRSNP
jgi:hypothetical protein